MTDQLQIGTKVRHTTAAWNSEPGVVTHVASGLGPGLYTVEWENAPGATAAFYGAELVVVGPPPPRES